jgi:hypothetical protein
MSQQIEIALEGLTNLDRRELVRALGAENVQAAENYAGSEGELRDISTAPGNRHDHDCESSAFRDVPSQPSPTQPRAKDRYCHK